MQVLQRGLLALQHGDLVQARSAFEAVTKEDPRNAFAWASLAETYGRLKQPSAAAAAATQAEKLGAGNPAISHALAMYFAKAGNFGHAAELEKEFAESGRADPGALERVASLFLDGGKIPEALDAAQKAAAQNPSAAAEDTLGRSLLASGRADEGQAHLAAAWEAEKTNGRFAFDYGQALLQKEDSSKAAEVFSIALQAHADDAQLVLALGVARYSQRRFEDAITAFLQVIRIDPQVEQPYLFLGRMLDQAGEHLPEVTSCYEKWLVRNPKSAQANLLLAKARLASDPKDSTAEGLLRRSLVLEEKDWEGHYELGILLEGKREWTKAAVELRRSAELDPKQAMAHYHLARVYDRLGEGEKAKAERELHESLTGGPK